MMGTAAVKKTTSEPETKKNAPPPATPPTSVVDSAGTKSFDMQSREVDAVKAVTQVMAHPKSFGKPSDKQGGNFSSDNSNNGNLGDGAPYKGKRKPHKGNKQSNPNFNGNSERPLPTPPNQAKAPFEQHHFGSGGETNTGSVRKYNNNNNKYRNDTNDWNDNGKYPGGDSGPPSFSSKPRGGGPSRFNRSNTFDESRPPRHYQNQDNGGFRSVRVDPRQLFVEKMTPQPAFKKMMAVHDLVDSNNDDYRHQQGPHPHHAPFSDPVGFRSPSGSWYPRQDAQALIARQVQLGGRPPSFMPSHGMMPPPPSSTGRLVPMPFPQSQHGQMLPQALEQMHAFSHAPLVMPTVLSATAAPDKTTTGAQNTPSTSSAETIVASASEELSAVVFSKNDEERLSSSIREVPDFYDPRPPQIRIESLMTTIACELEQLKRRITPGLEHKIKPVEMTRYLDTCTALCKHVTKASFELTQENEAMKRYFDAAAGKGGSAGNASSSSEHDDSCGLKMGSTPHSRTHSLSLQQNDNQVKAGTESKINLPRHGTDNVVVVAANAPTHTLPSGALTQFAPPIPSYAGYFIDKTPRSRPIENQNMDSAMRGPWWVRKNHEFVESERERMGVPVDEDGGPKSV